MQQTTSQKVGIAPQVMANKNIVTGCIARPKNARTPAAPLQSSASTYFTNLSSSLPVIPIASDINFLKAFVEEAFTKLLSLVQVQKL
ncbi:TPA: hypothetical protein QCR57_004709 [Bacillus cereus]|nr:hypothetical protein [Bacillus cereus]HDR4804576.1 hypothetical protein [Bacillus cereus]HDR4810515.1 hypothetical protein [Bacillus cereus]HDR4832980.1 hypothetical protein [Bacillus cereus]HDR4839415.1 hypothetical protein [Bacillus cereus]